MNSSKFNLKKMESHVLYIKINTFWRLQYFILTLRKNRSGYNPKNI